jgi:Transposase DDE domain group 1
MSIQPAWQETLPFFAPQTLLIEPSHAQLSSDAGLLPIRQFDQRIGLTQSFADALDDPRDPDTIDHTLAEMVRARVYGILADYADQNDHDTLRHDPVFKLVAGRAPDDDPLASQPTLSRFENAVSIKSLKRLRDVFIDQFIASFDTPPRHLTFDLDAVDDAAHGCQQLTFWHNYYDQNQYLPLLITCADNDQLLMLSLRYGSAHAALGADDDLAYLVGRLRRVWPDVVISARADAAFGIPDMYDVSERLNILYTFGLTANRVLQRRSDALLAQAVAVWAQERQAARDEQRPPRPVRLFDGFWYQAGTWPAARWVVVKAEANAEGNNRRFVVTNRPGAVLLPGATYDDYALRGESENRNKEFKCGLGMDRLSDHRFLANYFRLYLHAAALNLLVRLRRLVALPAPTSAPPGPAAVAGGSAPLPVAALAEERQEQAAPGGGGAASALPAAALPAAALAGEERGRHFRQRRQRDPLGEGHPCTWRSLFIKVAAEILVSSRRIVVRLSSSWPHLGLYQQICERLRAPLPAAPLGTG